MTARDSKGSERNLTVLVRYEMKRDGAGYRKGDVVLLVENDKGARYTITLRRAARGHTCTCRATKKCYHITAAVAMENTRAAARVALVRAEMAMAPQIQTQERNSIHDTARKSTANERGSIRRDYRSTDRAA